MIDAERKDRVVRLLRQRALRAVLTRVLTLKRVARLLGENLMAGATEEIPVLDAVTTGLAFADDMTFIRDVSKEVRAGQAALQFVEHGPHELGDLLASTEDRSFDTYAAFRKIDLEKVYGSAGEGQDWHHIVEQGRNAGAITISLLQSTKNIVRIPRLLHEELNSFYATKQQIGNESFVPREYLRGKSFEEQYEFGLYAMRRLGILH